MAALLERTNSLLEMLILRVDGVSSSLPGSTDLMGLESDVREILDELKDLNDKSRQR